jgi:hypothetical protein
MILYNPVHKQHSQGQDPDDVNEQPHNWKRERERERERE